MKREREGGRENVLSNIIPPGEIKKFEIFEHRRESLKPRAFSKEAI